MLRIYFLFDPGSFVNLVNIYFKIAILVFQCALGVGLVCLK